ncbi:hypothetical protein Tco_1415654 [Tanacetum coccineum]
MFDQGLAKEITEMKEVFNQMEIEVAKCSVARKYFEIEKKELFIENDRLLKHIICQDVMCIVMHAELDNKCVVPANDDKLAYAEMEQSFIDEYSSVSDCTVQVNNSCVIALEMYKLDFEPLSPKLRKNREAHVDYLKKAKEHADTLHDIIVEARSRQPLDSALDYACKFTTRIQELLVYLSATCPSSLNMNEKLVAITLMNKSKKVRFDEPKNPKSNTPIQADSQNSKITNKPLLTSTGVKSSTSASGSKPSGNTKQNRISRTTCSNQKNKVEDHLRSVKSSLNKKNRVYECNASTKHVVFDANSKLVCSTCNECLFNACRDMCVVDYLNNVNKHAKSRSFKINKKKDWKPTGKVFTNVGHRWIPTGQTFTIDGTKFPLTRITSTIVVPPKRHVPAKLVKNTPTSRTNLGKPKAKSIVSSISKSRIVESRISNNSKPNKIGDPMFPTLHLLLVSNACRTDRPLVFGLGLLQTHDGTTLSAHQFCQQVYGHC